MLIRCSIILYFFLIITNVLNAGQLSVKMIFGYPMTTFSAGEVYSGEDLGATLLLKPEITINFPSSNVAVFAYFSMHVMSPYGIIPIAAMGAGTLYYPNGFPIVSMDETQNTELKYKKFAPYFGLASGISRLSISDTSQNRSFLSNTFDITAIAGFDYPFSNSLVGGLELSYSSSIIGGSSSDGSSANNASINGCFSISYYP